MPSAAPLPVGLPDLLGRPERLRAIARAASARFGALAIGLLLLTLPRTLGAAEQELPLWQQDRGRGLPTSLFGTYIEKGELLFYPFYEFSFDSDEEYSPDEFGFTGSGTFEGETTEHQLLGYLAYAPLDWLAFELEWAAFDHKKLEKDASDLSALPSDFTESGTGDLEAQARWRWFEETQRRPEFYNYFEVIFPLYDSKQLIRASDWEFDFGGGLIKGSRFGTFSARISLSYAEGEGVQFGEYAVEYLKRLSPAWRLYAGIEGVDDEVSFVPELQYFFRDDIYLKAGIGVGLTSKAADVAPEIGILFSF